MIPAFPTLPQTVDERSVDLECLEREALEIAQGRVPHPEIVETELHAERPQLVERLEDGVGMLEDDALGDLELETCGIEAGSGRGPWRCHEPAPVRGIAVRRDSRS
jgi:hypothetical protein